MLYRQRGGICSMVTRVEKYLLDMTDEELSIPGRAEDLMSQRRMVENMREKYEGCQKQIIELQDTDTKRLQEEHMLKAFQGKCELLIQRIDELIPSAEPSFSGQDSVPGSNAASAVAAEMTKFIKAYMDHSNVRFEQQMDMMFTMFQPTASTYVNPHTRPLVKLPQIALPTFSGKYSEWVSFRDRFTASIINYPNTSDGMRLEYLLSAVSGEAKATISHLHPCDDNFAVAWQLLVDRFEKPDAISAELIRLFHNTPTLSAVDPQKLRHLHTTVTESVMSLDAMKITQRDPWLIQSVLNRVDPETRMLWARESNHTVSSWVDFVKFLGTRCDTLEACSTMTKTTSHGSSRNTQHSASSSQKRSSALIASTNQSLCRCCQEQAHPLYRCPKFLKQSPNERFETVKELKLCRNCLVSNHMSNVCQFRKCRLCHSGHNLLLHDKFVNSGGAPGSSRDPVPNPETPNSSVNIVSTTSSTVASANIDPAISTQPTRVFLATAVVDIFASSRDRVPCRMVLDSGAQICVMTTDLFQRLRLPKIPADISVIGVGSHNTRVKFCTYVTIQSRISDDTFSFLCYVMPRITGNLPNWKVSAEDIVIPAHTIMADPDWAVERPVDLLICGDSYWASWLSDKIFLGPGKPQLIETVFGYVVVGEHRPVAAPENEIYCNLTLADPSNLSIEEELRRFWEVENATEDQKGTEEHLAAEEHFLKTHIRNVEGRFVVSLPFRESRMQLGDSRSLALRQFCALERKFDRNPELKRLYCEVMEDYLTKGWMERVPSESLENKSYYMPHHGVLKDSTTTKLRIVYNASAKTSTGVSLNDLLLVGPFVQPDLCTILLRFRRHPIAVTADISKMYHQLLLNPEHADFQRLLWRPNQNQPVGDYRIVRVCFGIASSPFHATRALMQLAQLHEQSHPLASEALKNSFYVDDFITSVSSRETAVQIRSQLEEVLNAAGFVLTKWVTNDQSLFSRSATHSKEDLVTITNCNTKALGVRYDPLSDMFSFPVPAWVEESICTKRHIASYVAKIFDPIGLVGPIVIEAKMILQELHEMKIGWDIEIPAEYKQRWDKFLARLQDLRLLEIPRWISDIQEPVHMDLHVFCDASVKAYGVAIYSVTKDSEERVTSRLLSAKSRVAPLKKLTIPKLELCGALLAAVYADRVKKIYNPDNVFYWTDSSVVLCWIHRPPTSGKIFVTHRTDQILKLTSSTQWKHVSTEWNPADLISRGVSPLQLRDSQLWWSGPDWISLPESQWPASSVDIHQAIDDDIAVLLNQTKLADPLFEDVINRFSNLKPLQRVVGYCLRYLHNLKPNNPRLFGLLSTVEMESALMCLIFMEQRVHLEGVHELIKKGNLQKSRWRNLASLNPFVDDRGVIRVGGRLKNANISFAAKHPALLPKSRLALLIAQHEHHRNLHAPPTLLLAIMRLRFWPLGGRNLVRKVFHSCVPCFKAKPVPAHQIMGDLPRHRVTLQRPFHAVGVDLCGPIYARPDTPRSRGVLKKVYVIVFVCLATKAAHLELVHDQSAEEFLQSFRRFCARRNRPRHVYSDCGKNFEGANNELARQLQLEQSQQKICASTRDEGIIWHFNPPGSPHHGGLWEACVKSLKYHLLRVTNGTNFLIKDLTTILCQVEAVLNSRPLCKLTEDPNDDTFLTPGHFLTGAPLAALPDPDCTPLPLNRLSGSQMCQRKFQEFLRRWHLQYLNTLQQRVKWKTPQQNLKVDDAVLLLDETGRWVLGRIVETHPGQDGQTRVASIRTKRGTYKRSITKCARLPLSDSLNSCSNKEQAGEDV